MVAILIPSMIARLVLSTAVKVVVYPLISTIETVSYYDIRIRREGFDIEYLAAIAPQSPLPRAARLDVIFRWTPGQVHDTVAAIVAQRGYVGQRESLAARFLRFILDKIGQLLDLVRGSIDAKVIIAAAVILVAVVIAARIAIDRRAAERRARLAARSRTGEGRRDAWAEARDAR